MLIGLSLAINHLKSQKTLDHIFHMVQNYITPKKLHIVMVIPHDKKRKKKQKQLHRILKIDTREAKKGKQRSLKS